VKFAAVGIRTLLFGEISGLELVSTGCDEIV
jgi:hypothetical protein